MANLNELIEKWIYLTEKFYHPEKEKLALVSKIVDLMNLLMLEQYIFQNPIEMGDLKLHKVVLEDTHCTMIVHWDLEDKAFCSIYALELGEIQKIYETLKELK